MRKKILHLVLLFVGFSCLGLFLFGGQKAQAANPNLINFQGKVVNADGTNVTNGTYSFNFVLFDDPTAGTESDGVHDKWHELSKSVAVTNGVFQTELGSATALPDFSQFSALYLGVKFNSDSAGYMTPRIHLDSAPYAKYSDNSAALGGLAATNFVQLAQGLQTDSSTTNASIAVNKTNASGTPDILLLQKSGQNVLEVNNSGTTLLGQAGASGLNGTLTFNNAAGSHTVSLSLQADPGSSYTLLLPNTGPSTSQCLQTDGTVANQLVFAACTPSGSGATSVAYSATPNANGGSIAGSVLTLAKADGTNPGLLSADAQTIGGLKTFQGGINVNSGGSILQTTNGPVYQGGADISGSTNSGTGNNSATQGQVVVSGRYAYKISSGNATACSQSAGSAIGCELQVYDVSNPTTPTYVGGADSTGSTNSGTGGGFLFSIAVSGHYAYVTSSGNATACSQTAGSAIGCELQVYDVSNPSAPKYVGGADVTGSTNSGTGNNNANNVYVSGRYAYVATFGSATACSQSAGSAIGCELQVYDVSNPTTPTYVGGADVSGSTNSGTGSSQIESLYVSGRYAYVTTAGNATACSQTAGSAIGCELQVYDVSNPSAPSYVGGADVSGSTNSGTTSASIYSISISGRYAYVTNGGSGTACSQSAGSALGCELQVYDISNPATPTYVGGADSSGSANSGTGNFSTGTSVNVAGRYAYVTFGGSGTACSQTAGSAIGCELQVYDISSPATPTYVGGADVSGSTNSGTSAAAAPFSVYVSGRYAYTVTNGAATACSGSAGSAVGCELQVYDVSGVEATSGTFGSLYAGSVQVQNAAQFNDGASISGGLTVGQSAQVSGDLGVSGLVSIQPATAFSGSSPSSLISETFTNNQFTTSTYGLNQTITVSNGSSPTGTIGIGISLTDNGLSSNFNSDKGIQISLNAGTNTSQSQTGIDVTAARGIGIKAASTGVAGGGIACGPSIVLSSIGVCGTTSAASSNAYGGSFAATGNGGTALFATNGTSTANIFQLQDGTSPTNVFTVADGGLITITPTSFTGTASVIGITEAMGPGTITSTSGTQTGQEIALVNSGTGNTVVGLLGLLTNNGNTTTNTGLWGQVTDSFSSASTNTGVKAVTTGTNANQLQYALDASANHGIGVRGASTGAGGSITCGPTTAANSIGVCGTTTLASSAGFGGYFAATGNSGTALFATNGTSTANIFQLQDGTTPTTVFTVADGGITTAKSNSATGFQIQDSSNSKSLFTVDTSGDQAVLGMQGASGVNGKIQFNTTNASNTFVSLAAASTASSFTLTLPTSLPGASNYCIVSTNLGALSFSACGASSTATVTLSPEFPGAVLTADGTSNTGTMTSDFCSGSGSGGININAAICDGATATAHNYYAWTASATNDYDVWTQWQMPTDWASFSSITFAGKVSTTTSDSVVLTIYKVGQTAACGSGTINTGTTWQTSSSISTASCTLSPGDKIYFDAKLTVGVTSDFARLGEINIVYNRS
jgi:hypothetical protein